jgi:pullulanase/glycogen debranching enzyme
MDAYHAYQSVNHFTLHDGFSLYDLVAYHTKRNLAKGLALCLHGGSVEDNDLYVMINGFWRDLSFRIQEGAVEEWHLAIDTSRAPTVMDGMDGPVLAFQHQIPARSVSVFVRGQPRRQDSAEEPVKA